MVDNKDPKKKEDPAADTPTQEEHSKQPGTGAFSRLTRELGDDDLKNPAVGRMLLDRIDGLSAEKLELEGYRDMFHDADKKAALFEQKALGESKFQILYSFCLTVGGVVFGIAFAISDNSVKWILIFTGIVLFLIGIGLSFFVNKK